MPAPSGTGNAPVRRSLVESTAETFRRAAAAHPPAVPAAAFGATDAAGTAAGMLAGQAPTIIRRSLPGSLLTAGSPRIGEHAGDVPAMLDSREPLDVSRLPARDLHRLVDAVVQAIEARVIDELERRGRRHPGVF